MWLKCVAILDCIYLCVCEREKKKKGKKAIRKEVGIVRGLVKF